MTFDPDHLATLNEAATPQPWFGEDNTDHSDGTTAHIISGVVRWRGYTDNLNFDEDEATRDLVLYLRNHVDAILDQAAELATLRARVEELTTVDVLFDGPPSHQPGRFIEVETLDGRSVRAGDWIDRGDGYWALRLDVRLAASTPDTGSET